LTAKHLKFNFSNHFIKRKIYIKLRNLIYFYLPKEHVIWLIFDGHQHNQNSIEELETLQRRDAHVQEDTEQHRHRYIPQHWC